MHVNAAGVLVLPDLVETSEARSFLTVVVGNMSRDMRVQSSHSPKTIGRIRNLKQKSYGSVSHSANV